LQKERLKLIINLPNGINNGILLQFDGQCLQILTNFAHHYIYYMQVNLLELASRKKIITIKKSLQFGWETFLKNPWFYVLYTGIGMLVNLLIAYIPIIGPFILFAIGLPLQLGIASFWYFKNQHRDASFKHFFDVFFTTKNLIIFLLIVCAFLLAIMIPLFVVTVAGEVTNDIATGGTTSKTLSWPTTVAVILYTPIILFFTISIVWAPYFIYFYQMTAWQSIKMSYAFIKPRWFSYLLFYLVIVGISMLGAISGLILSLYGSFDIFGFNLQNILSVIGLLITTPIISLAVFYQFFQLTELPVHIAKLGDTEHEEMMSAELA
jgi:hypothetical protein